MLVTDSRGRLQGTVGDACPYNTNTSMLITKNRKDRPPTGYFPGNDLSCFLVMPLNMSVHVVAMDDDGSVLWDIFVGEVNHHVVILKAFLQGFD